MGERLGERIDSKSQSRDCDKEKKTGDPGHKGDRPYLDQGSLLGHEWVLENGGVRYCARCGLRKKRTSKGLFYEPVGGRWIRIHWPMKLPDCREERLCPRCQGTGKV